MTPDELKERGLRVRQRGDLTLVDNWPAVWSVPWQTARKRFCARKRDLQMPVKLFPTRKAALLWVLAIAEADHAARVAGYVEGMG